MEKADFQKLLGEGLKEFKSTVMEEIKGEIKTAVEPIAERIEKIEKSPASKVFGAPAVVTGVSKYRGYNLSKQLVSIRERAAKNPRLFTSFANDEKAEDFAKFIICYTRLMKGDFSAMADMQEFQAKYGKANYAEGSGSTGGYLVPEEFEAELMQIARDESFALKNCAVYEMGTDNKKVPKEGSLVQVAWHDEAADISDGEGTFGEIDLVAKRLDGMATVSNELLQDAAFDLAGVLTEQFATATGLEVDNQVLNGTGSPFNGVATSIAGASVVMAGGDTNFEDIVADDFSKMMSLLRAGYLKDAKFVINRAALHFVRTLKDGEDRPIFAMPGGTVPGTIYGLPYIESEQANGTNAANKMVAVLGSWKRYAIGRRVGTMALDSDPYGLFKKNQTRFRMVTRWGLKIGIAEAFVRYMTAAA